MTVLYNNMEFAIKNFKPVFNVFKPTKNNTIPKYNINIKSKKDYNGDYIKSIRFEKTISIIDVLKLFIEKRICWVSKPNLH